MGKSHIGLAYSQEINELLDKLANMVNTSSTLTNRHLSFLSFLLLIFTNLV